MTQQGEFVINPNTKRPIKVGGNVWRKLVKTNILEDKYSDPAELYKLEPDEDAEKKIQELNKNLPINQQSVRGRGKYKGKIVRRNRTLNTTDVAKYTSKLATKILKEKANSSENLDDMSEDEMSEMLSNMLIEKMTGSKPEHNVVKKPTYKIEKEEKEEAEEEAETEFPSEEESDKSYDEDGEGDNDEGDDDEEFE
jgi:hypothetical protein